MPVITIDAPVGGINAFDSPENMAPTDAIALDNWICRAGYLESRPPEELFYDVPMNTLGYLAVYHGVSGEQLILQRSDGNVYNISSGSAVAAGTGVGDYLAAFSFEINGKLIIGSGAGTEVAYDGSTCTALNYTGSSPAIDPTGAFTQGCNFKGRAIYINSGSALGSLAAVNSFWYAEAGSYQGNITEFPLGSISRFGGTPKCVGVWTMDTGTGPDDTLVIYYTTGEILLYQGDDPGDADNWELIGSFRVGPPQSSHALFNYGADVILLTTTGYVRLSDALKADQTADLPAFSRRIWPQIADMVAGAGTGAGWLQYNRGIVWGGGLILFMFAYSGASIVCTYCLNPSTGAWSRFPDIAAYTGFVSFNGDLYYCSANGSGDIYKLSTYATATETITCSAIPAFTDLGDPTARKQITAVQFMTNHPDPKLIEVTGYSDFNLEGTLPTPAAYTGGSPPSESGVGVFPKMRKAMAHTFTRGWQNLHAFGHYVSMAVQMATNDRTLYWRATNVRYRKMGR